MVTGVQTCALPILFNWWDPVWPEGMEKMLNPKVSVRMRGIVEKCSFCYHRFQQAKDKAYMNGKSDVEEQDYQTSCAQACPAGAITFGDLNNPKHAVTQLVIPDYKHHNRPKNPHAFRLLERLGTNAKVYYISSREWVRKMGDNYLPNEKQTASH